MSQAVSKLKRILKWAGILLLLVSTVFYLFFRFGLSMAKSDREVAELFAGAARSPEYFRAEVGGYTIRYARIGNPAGALVVCIHGSPGSWDAWLPYFRDTALTRQIQLVAFDRPGFNQSFPHEPATSLVTQAEVLRPLLDTLAPGRPVIVVGHSYGGPVAVEAACRFPDKVKAVLILAGSIDPALEKPFFGVQRFLAKPGWRKLLPPDMDVSNREILPLKKELERQKACWENIRASVCVLQGEMDVLVPAENAAYAAKMAPDVCGTTLLPEENHFFIWTRPGRVQAVLLDLIEKVE